MNNAYRTKIVQYNSYIDAVVRYCISGLPIEYRFGYVNVSIDKEFPSWIKIFSRNANVDYRLLPLTLFAYFNGDRVTFGGEYAAIGTVQVEYNYKFDLFLPVSRENKSEEVFWERVQAFLDRFRNYDYRVRDIGLLPVDASTFIITPLSADFASPYLEFANYICHYASYSLTIIDTTPYSSAEGVIVNA